MKPQAQLHSHCGRFFSRNHFRINNDFQSLGRQLFQLLSGNARKLRKKEGGGEGRSSEIWNLFTSSLEFVQEEDGVERHG